MNGDNRKLNVVAELGKSRESLGAARPLHDGGFHADSITRSYYAVFHVLRALALSRGIEPKTHAGAIHIFNQEFVRTGLASPSNNLFVSGLQRSRELADYDAAVLFGPDESAEQLTKAEAFCRAMAALLPAD